MSVLAVSSCYFTRAVGQPGQPDYVNGAILVESALSAQNILKILKRLEIEAGRERVGLRTAGRWGARSLDLDIIDYKGKVSKNFRQCSRGMLPRQQQDCHLVLPHPEVVFRPFVLRPLMDIAPFWHHPVSGLSVQVLWQRLRFCASGRVLSTID